MSQFCKEVVVGPEPVVVSWGFVSSLIRVEHTTGDAVVYVSFLETTAAPI